MKQKYKCKKCAYEWKARIEFPISCPRCKSYDWKKGDKDENKSDN